MNAISRFKPSTIEALGGVEKVQELLNTFTTDAEGNDKKEVSPIVVASQFVTEGTTWGCVRCGECCRRSDIILEYDDLRKLAKHFDVSVKEAAKRYTIHKKDDEGIYHYFFKMPCRFQDVDTEACTIYPARPEVCRIWPLDQDKATGQIFVRKAPSCKYVETATEITQFMHVFSQAVALQTQERQQQIAGIVGKWFGLPESFKDLGQEKAIRQLATSSRRMTAR